MPSWFTVEQIDPQTFAISEYGHWEETHSYLLCGKMRAILIDTGLGVSDIRKTVDELTDLPVTAVVTHAHWDHIGGLRSFDRFAVHELEKDWLCTQFPLFLQAVKENLTARSCVFPQEFNIDAYQLFRGVPQRVLHDGDRLDLGDREIHVLHTPGHSPGHCCFYEPVRKYMYTGDLIYQGCLDAFYPSTDPQLFYASVQKIRRYETDAVFPGHHRLDIPAFLIPEIENGFAQLSRKDLLKHGGGLFDFGDFQIRI